MRLFRGSRDPLPYNLLERHGDAIPEESKFCPHAILIISAVAVIYYRRVPAGNVVTNVA